MEIGRSELLRLTFGKGTVNTAIRWLPFFLPTLAVAFDSSTAALALLLGIAEGAGLTTIAVGRVLDAGRERLVIIAALLAIVLSSALAIAGSIWTFAIAVAILGAASGHVTVGGHAWISARVPFHRRARFIGVYEISWASALLVGVPVIAVLISAFGWRAPFIATAAAAVVAAFLVWTINDGVATNRQSDGPADTTPLTVDAWLIIAASAAIAMAGLTTIVVAGTWLDGAFGVSTGGVGLLAMAVGAVELTASSGSSAFADRLGKRRTIQYSVTATLAGLGIIASAGESLAIGTVGLLVFFLGFEYSIVTSFSLVSEAMPAARGRVLGIGNGTNTLARGIGVSSAGLLYEAYGIAGPAGLSAIAATAALILLTIVAARRPDLA
ncbi:MAG: MFS transporter [Actinomycetota bacterium]